LIGLRWIGSLFFLALAGAGALIAYATVKFVKLCASSAIQVRGGRGLGPREMKGREMMEHVILVLDGRCPDCERRRADVAGA
jgi:hypothetical protein